MSARPGVAQASHRSPRIHTPDRWRDSALCAHIGDPTLFFPDKQGTWPQEAQQICARCPVRAECLDHALTHHEHGVWGGLTETQRRALRRRETT